MSLRPLRTVWFSQLLRGFERAGLQPYISALRQDGNIILVSTPMFSWVGFSTKSSPIKYIEPLCRKLTWSPNHVFAPCGKTVKVFWKIFSDFTTRRIYLSENVFVTAYNSLVVAIELFEKLKVIPKSWIVYAIANHLHFDQLSFRSTEWIILSNVTVWT